MEQIERINGILFYGKDQCKDVEELYRRFREDYHRSIGRAAYKRLNRIGSRHERVHESGLIFSERRHNPIGVSERMVPVRFLGLISGAYCKVLCGWDLPEGTEEELEQWIDWAFSKGSGALRIVGKNLKTGRTSDRLNKRYR